MGNLREGQGEQERKDPMALPAPKKHAGTSHSIRHHDIIRQLTNQLNIIY